MEETAMALTNEELSETETSTSTPERHPEARHMRTRKAFEQGPLSPNTDQKPQRR